MNRKTPKTIAQNADGWFWGIQWRKMHNRRQQTCACLAGSPGSGKSYAALDACNLLDRGADDKPRFSLDNVAFSSEQFLDIVTQKLPIGSCILLDDAALLAYSGDTLKKETKEISKIFMSQRHLRRGVFLTMPSLTMLTKVVVQTLQYFIDMKSIDEAAGLSRAKLLRLQLNTRSGKLYFKNYSFMHSALHPTLHVPVSRKHIRPLLTFQLPPPAIAGKYEDARREAMQDHYEKAEKIIKGTDKKRRHTFVQDYNEVKQNLEKYSDEQGLSKGKMLLGGIPHRNVMEIKSMLGKRTHTR